MRSMSLFSLATLRLDKVQVKVHDPRNLIPHAYWCPMSRLCPVSLWPMKYSGPAEHPIPLFESIMAQ
jgi:hypothetical protein